MENFDFVNCTLDGRHSISANAGTGKTFTIAHLYLRLIIEREYSIDSILVVTYTEAATEELKNRIRSLLKDTLDFCKTGENQNIFISDIVNKNLQIKENEKIIQLLSIALASFDEAQIFTIHGFCNRVLRDYAFETGVSFDNELVTEQIEFVKNAVYDYYRKSIYNEEELFVKYVSNNKIVPDTLLDAVKNYFQEPQLKIVPELPPKEPHYDYSVYENLFEETKLLWEQSSEEVFTVLNESESLNRKKYGQKYLPGKIKRLEILLNNSEYRLEHYDELIYFTQENIDSAIKNEKPPVSHPFFTQFSHLYNEYTNLCNYFAAKVTILKQNMFDYVQQWVQKQKEKSQVLSFDDLLLYVYNALNGSRSESLLTAIKEKTKAVLIDEFQDTDPVQYHIFQRFFDVADGDTGTLFLIGDPKQAIYGFRSADIFTYMGAIEETVEENRHTLQTNFRSSGELVKGVNTLFSSVKNSFIYEMIPFLPSSYPDESLCYSLNINNLKSRPLEVVYFPRDESDPKKYCINGQKGRECNYDFIVSEIISLLTSGTIVNENEKRSVIPQDIVVLVRNNFEAQDMKKLLSTHNVPAVLHNSGSVYESDEAWELLQILAAIIAPDNISKLKAALCTSIMGFSLTGVIEKFNDDSNVEFWIERFLSYHKIWNDYGFIRMFNTLVQENSIKDRLLSLNDGERRMTNIVHLQELIQKKDYEEKISTFNMVKWFGELLGEGDTKDLDKELRLEKDSNAVEIITIHRSKGLEYNIVFCPFMWGSSKLKGNYYIYHDDENQRVYDISGDKENPNKAIAEEELLAENIRLLYVALTRAKYKCYLSIGDIEGYNYSAPAYLLHHDRVQIQKEFFKKNSTDDLRGDVEYLVTKSDGTIGLRTYIKTPILPYEFKEEIPLSLSVRSFSGELVSGRKVSSFSSLSHSTVLHEYITSYDSSQESEDDSENEFTGDIFSFYRGAKAGTFLHSLYEDLEDYRKSDDLKQLIIEGLERYGYEEQWERCIFENCQNVLGSPLPHSNFTMSSLTPEQCKKEFEFYFPIQNITVDLLKRYISGEKGLDEMIQSSIGRLTFNPTKGYMHGFIDLLFCKDDKFYIVDWKSNYLGDTTDSYTIENMKRVMSGHHYFLQYYIYTIAVDMYLKNKIKNYSYEKHFGGVYYIFLRGVDSSGQNGIFFDKPPQQLIETLSQGIIVEK